MPVHRVRRVIRKIDPWSVLKVALVFNGVMAVVFVLGAVVFWAIFVNAGIPERINEMALLIGLENGLNLQGAVYFRIVLLLALLGMIFMTGFMTLGVVIYNLITDIVGGIEVIVLEDSTPVTERSKVAMPLAASRRRGILPPLRREGPDKPDRPPAMTTGRADSAESPEAGKDATATDA
jgi:hypothetical protein